MYCDKLFIFFSVSVYICHISIGACVSSSCNYGVRVQTKGQFYNDKIVSLMDEINVTVASLCNCETYKLVQLCMRSNLS